MKKKPDPTSSSWVAQTTENRWGTLLFKVVIARFGLTPAYLLLFFAALQYTFCDRKSIAALRMFRLRLGCSTSLVDLFRHFYSYGMALIDRQAAQLSARSLFFYSTENELVIRELVGRGKGVILLGAHVGNWEIPGNLLFERVGVPVHVFMYDAHQTSEGQSEGGAAQHAAIAYHYINTEGPETMIAMVGALRRGEIVCLHGDRAFASQRTITLPFLGREARFPVGPFTVAAVTGAAIVPFFAVKTGLHHYTFSANRPFDLAAVSREHREEEIRRVMTHYLVDLESICRKHPFQWYNFYPFWRDG